MPEEPDATVTLSDGRRLAYAEYGDPDGRPVVFLHGTPGSRLSGRLLADAAAAVDVRLLAPDRPGIGGSDPDPNRDLLDWPADVAELTDALGLDRFGVVGFSAGGPYALACAHELPERVVAVGLVSAVGAPSALSEASRSRLVYSILSRAPWVARGPYRAIATLLETRPSKLRQLLASNFAEPDAELLDDDRTRTVLFDDFREAFRQGTAGTARDVGLLAREWGFDVNDVTRPVAIWHGYEDRSVPPSVARETAARLPASNCSLLDGEGHFSTLTTADKPLLWRATPDGASRIDGPTTTRR